MGWSGAEIIGQPTVMFFTPEDRALGAPEQELRIAREQGRAEDERWHIRKDGSRFWGSGLVQPVYESGALHGYIKIFRDLTERQHHEQELRDANRRLQVALNAGEIGTWTWDIVANRVYADKNLARFFSVSEEDARGGPIEHYIRAIHSDDRARVEAILQEAITHHTPYEAEYRLVKPDGSLTWATARGSVEYDTQGNPDNLPGVVLDITKRRAAEQAQVEAQTQAQHDRILLDAVLDALPVGVAIADASGKLVRINAAFEQIWGGTIPLAQVVQEYGEYVGYWHGTGKRFEATEWAMARALRGEVCPGDLAEIEKFDGSGRSVIINSAAPVYDATGAIIGGVAAEMDITAQIRAEEALHRNQVEIEGLNVRLQRAMQESHHRIKNNLQVIAALVEMQAEELGNGAAVQRIKQHVRSLATIHDLLTRQAKMNASTSVISVQEVLEHLIPMLQSTNQERHIKADIDEVMLPVQKATSLSLLVSECVSNAIKHAHGEVEITLRLSDQWPPEQERRAERWMQLEVCDDGPGFPPGFDPRRAANTGLELIDSTARWDLRGEVRYETRSEGGGRVVVMFPITQEAEE